MDGQRHVGSTHHTQAATTPYGFVSRTMVASVEPPTVSTAPAQSESSGLSLVLTASSRLSTRPAPHSYSRGLSWALPLTATTELTQLGQQPHREAADSARRPGDENLAIVRSDAVKHDSLHALSRGEAGCPQNHRFLQRHSLGNGTIQSAGTRMKLRPTTPARARPDRSQ